MADDFVYYPQNCVWEITLKCTMRCIHCGSKAGLARENELSLDECLDVADQLLELGCEHISFIGGEVFLYPGWEKVAGKMSSGGAVTNIVTNGWLAGDEQIEQIKEANLHNVAISIDGMEESHNRIRNNPNSFQRVKKAIERYALEDIPVSVVTSLLDFSYYDLEDLYQFLKDRNVSVWQIQVVTGMGNIARKKDMLLKPDKIPLLTKFIREKRNEGDMVVLAADDIGYYDENELNLRSYPGEMNVWQGCQAGLYVVGIDSIGNVKGCESLYDDRFIEGNVRQESLREIWTKEGNFAYNRNFKPSLLGGSCAGCDRAEQCRGGCRGACFFTSDNLYENPYCAYPNRPS